MSVRVHTINVPMPLRMGMVNCYLLEGDIGWVLVDTGTSRNRGAIDWALTDADCGPKELRLILLTHGDFDHIGSAAYLRNEYSAKIAMHAADAQVARTGDMFAGRTRANAVAGFIAPKLVKFGKKEHFEPDVLLEDGKSLNRWGVEATVLHLPGHSAGSIGVLTVDGDLISGDLFENLDGPRLNSIMDNLDAAQASLQRLRELEIRTVYPGHGAPFKLTDLPAEET